MNKTSKNSCRLTLIALTCLSTLVSTLHLEVQLGDAQNNNGNYTNGIFPTLTAEQLQQLTVDGTSFDLFLKHRIDAMKAAKTAVNYTDLDSRFLKGINLCLSPLGKAFAQAICDFVMATVYEFCQAIPDQLSYICVMPSINNYLKDRNMVDGQTDKLAWQFLHSKEIAANLYESESNNSTEPTTNTRSATLPIIISNNLAPSDVVKFYEQKMPFDKLLQVILNQTTITQNHNPTQSEMFLLNAISDEVRTDSGEFVAGLGCGANVTNGMSIRTCDQDASFIHEVCAQSNVINITKGVCLANWPYVDEIAETYLQKRGISDPQTDAFAYYRLANILAKLNPSTPIDAVLKINLTKDGSLKHFGNTK